MITAIDTNILLDLLIPDALHANSSQALLDEAYQQGALIISESVYAELAARFPAGQEFENFLLRTGIRLDQSQGEALRAAGEAWQFYTARRGLELQCPQCGHIQLVTCSACGDAIRPRQHILADFLIGGNALHQADRLLTRDRGYYRTYFPALRLQEGA